MRLPSERRSSSGSPSVTTVANASTPTNAMIRKSRSKRILRTPTSVLMVSSVLEADHLFHHRDAEPHPNRTAGEHEIAHALGEEKFDVVGRGEVDQRHDHDGKRADDHGR